MSTVDNLPGNWRYLYKPNPTLALDGSIWKSKLSFVTDQSNIIPFLTVVSGTVQTVPGTVSPLIRLVSLQHPIYNWLWAYNFDCEMFGEASTTSDELIDLHSKVRVNVNFQSLTYPTAGTDPYLTWETRGNSLYATIPNRKMKFSSGEVLGQDAGTFISQVNYILTLYACPDLNDAFINGFMNTINDADFRGITAGHLRFDTWSSSFQVTSGGALSYTKQLIFTAQDHHWNQYYQTDGTLGTATDPDGNPTYADADFTTLLGA